MTEPICPLDSGPGPSNVVEFRRRPASTPGNYETAMMDTVAARVSLSALVVDLMQWRQRAKRTVQHAPAPVVPAAAPPGTPISELPDVESAPEPLPDYAYGLEDDPDWAFPPPSAALSVQMAWTEAVAPLDERDRRVAAAVFMAELRMARLRHDTPDNDMSYRHLVARLLYRDELIWRRHHGAYHAFARSLLIRFAMALSRQGVA